MSVTISWQVQDTFFGAKVIMSVFYILDFYSIYNRMKTKKYHTVGTFRKSNRLELKLETIMK